MADRKSIVVVEDDRTGMSPKALRRAVLDHLQFTRAKDIRSATLLDVYHALSHTVRDRLVHRWMWTQRTYAEKDVKRVYYLSAEYLLGRQLQANLLNLGLMDFAREGLTEYKITLADVLEEEEDPGLGNGGLGRLAACFMDSLATLEYPAMGYGIRYEFGIFRQGIRNGWQMEQPDEWLRKGNPWEIARPEYAVEVKFGGRVEEDRGDNGEGRRMKWVGGETVLGVPYDTPVAGFGTFTVNTLPTTATTGAPWSRRRCPRASPRCSTRRTTPWRARSSASSSSTSSCAAPSTTSSPATGAPIPTSRPSRTKPPSSSTTPTPRSPSRS
jgi:starch phosphorylase